MNIKRTCLIELSAEEAREALTNYVIKKHEYHSSEGIKSWEECLSPCAPMTILWGEAPEVEAVAPERDEPASSGVTVSEAACKQVGDERNPEPTALIL